jgi:hypothetical protein
MVLVQHICRRVCGWHAEATVWTSDDFLPHRPAVAGLPAALPVPGGSGHRTSHPGRGFSGDTVPPTQEPSTAVDTITLPGRARCHPLLRFRLRPLVAEAAVRSRSSRATTGPAVTLGRASAGQRSMKDVTADLGITRETLRLWVRAAEDGGSQTARQTPREPRWPGCVRRTPDC